MPFASYALLLLAAGLEVGGDALVRLGLLSEAVPARAGLILAGGLVLLAYGLLVNTPSWDFGRLLGVYVSLFFLVAQAVNWSLFGAKPSPPMWIGGSLIIAGGLIITLWPVQS
jgi:small multidrug resistance family-3 protein